MEPPGILAFFLATTPQQNEQRISPHHTFGQWYRNYKVHAGITKKRNGIY